MCADLYWVGKLIDFADGIGVAIAWRGAGEVAVALGAAGGLAVALLAFFSEKDNAEGIKNLQIESNELTERQEAVKVSWYSDGLQPDWPTAVVVQNYSSSPVSSAILTFSRSKDRVDPDQYIQTPLKPCQLKTYTFKSDAAKHEVHNLSNTAFHYELNGKYWLRAGPSFKKTGSLPLLYGMKNLERIVKVKEERIPQCP